jgi:hypothetical protein
MPGAVIILLASGGVGAMALGLWLLFRRSRSRPQLAVAAAPSTKLAIESPPADHVEGRASPEPVEVAGRGGLDDFAEPEHGPLADATPREPGTSNGDEHVALFATNPAVAVQPLEVGSEDSSATATLNGDESSQLVAPTAMTAAVLVGLEPETEATAFGQLDHELLHGEGQEELPDPATAVAVDEQRAPVPKGCAGAKALANEGQVSHGALLSSPPEKALFGQGDGELAGAIGETAGAAPTASTIAGEAFAEPDASGDAPSQGGRESEGPFAEGPPQPIAAIATDELPKPAAVADDVALETIEAELGAHPGTEVGQPLGPEEAPAEVVPAPRLRPSKPARHRDRRGQRRPPKAPAAPNTTSSTLAAALRTPAEARLRLIIHPVRRAVSISAVLARPAGYPDSITLLLEANTEIGAYGEERYDDVDLEWTPNLLSGEVRLDSREGYQWLRSSRRIHIFGEQADEQGLMSVGSATLNAACAVVCTQEDTEAVRSAAAACGSPELVSHAHWSGVPEGWVVLSGYRPAHAASVPLAPYLTILDPGVGAEIRLSGGLQVRSASFAQGSPPRIEIQPFPTGAQVTIDGMPADMIGDGSWQAAGWDWPGDHLVDVVPGPSVSYRIVGDPWTEGGWESWDAHSSRFLVPNDAPWARAQICGARVSGPSGEHVVAAEAMSSVIALGLRRGVAMLRVRPDAPVAFGLLREVPAFLISSSGPRRIQGRVDWLAPPSGERLARIIDLSWVAVVRSAASRRLPLSTDSPAGQEAWRRARVRARRYRRTVT